MELVTSGLNYGVHVILATEPPPGYPPQDIFENIGGYIELHLNDPTESAFKKAAAMSISAEYTGAGACQRESAISKLPYPGSEAQIDSLHAKHRGPGAADQSRLAGQSGSLQFGCCHPRLSEKKLLSVALTSWLPGMPLGIERILVLSLLMLISYSTSRLTFFNLRR